MSTIATLPAEQPELPFAPTEIDSSASAESAVGTVELAPLRPSSLGKRIEMLRVHRGLSKQALARSAGTSRQQLWRVMTGKSELTGALCHRLASVLDVDSRTLSSAKLGAHAPPLAADALLVPEATPASLTHFLASPDFTERALHALPAGEEGVTLKCALLNAVEERARAARLAIPGWLLRVRREVLDGAR